MADTEDPKDPPKVDPPKDPPVYTKAQLTEIVSREAAKEAAKAAQAAQERDALKAKLDEIEAERAKAEEAKMSAAQRAELERKREAEKIAAEIAALKGVAQSERERRLAVLRHGTAVQLAARFTTDLWSPDLMPHVETAIEQRLVVVDDGKGGERVEIRMGVDGDNEPVEAGFAKLREAPEFKGFIKQVGGSGAQHGAGAQQGSQQWRNLPATDRIKAGFRR